MKSEEEKQRDSEKLDAANPKKQTGKKAPVRKGVTFESGTRARGPGAPKGNLNNVKSYLPAIRRLQQGKLLPPRFERVTAIAEMEAGDLVSDQGGVENLSGAVKLTISTWKSARSCELLCWFEALERNSAMVEDQHGCFDMQPALQRISQFLSIQNRCLMSLGLDREPRSLQDVQAFVEENYSEQPEPE